MLTGKTFIHHYSPEARGEFSRVIIYRNADDPYMICKKEVDELYNKARRLLTTVETWLEYSVDDDITEETVQALYLSFNKVRVIVTEDIEELITTHEVTNRRDLFELRDVVTQLQEIADDVFKQHINSNSTEMLTQG